MNSKILIISNVYNDIELLKKKIEEKSCKVLFASTTQYALELIEVTDFDLILLDNNFIKHDHEILSTLEISDLPVMIISKGTQNNAYSKLLNFINNLDNLTGIYDRNYFDSKINKICEDAIKNNYALSLVIMDMDFFREVNNSSGHLAGDNFLKEVVKIIKSKIRADDIAIRFGGEEFALVFINISDLAVASIVERIRISIEIALGITASFGVAKLNKNDSVEDFINRADKALYKAKSLGRNKIIIM